MTKHISGKGMVGRQYKLQSQCLQKNRVTNSFPLAPLPHYPQLRTALLAGYRTIRPFPAQHEAYLETFFALRRIQLMSWVIESREHPAFRDGWVAWARNDLPELAGFLARA